MKSLLGSLGIMFVVAMQLSAQPHILPDPLEKQMYALAHQGSLLNAAQAADIEKRLEENPENLNDRVQLLGFYSSRRDSQSLLRRQEHSIWLLKNQPDNPVCATWGALQPGDPGYEQAKQIWFDYAATRKEPVIFRNAGRYFMTDTLLTTHFLQLGEALTPTDPYWEREIGRAYTQQAKLFGLRTSSRLRYATLAVAAFERALQIDPSSEISWMQGEAAYLAENWDKAKAWATQASKTNQPVNFHYGHWILGEVALHEGNIEKAKEELLASANVPDNQDVGLYNLRMNLADKLLKLGERDVVLAYLDRCAAFWKDGQAKLKEWTILIKNGLDPDFGPNSLL